MVARVWACIVSTPWGDIAVLNIKPEIASFHDDLTSWRRDFHAHPELGFEEVRTSAIVAEKLRSWGMMSRPASDAPVSSAR
jgi:metal-dependent amidase/aminoacylase/carboxypeptidase family protein